MEKSILNYERILSEPTSNFTEIAAIRVARYYYNNGEYGKAVPQYERTEEVSSDPEVVFNAKTGLMRSYYKIGEFLPAAAYAKQVLASNLLNPENKLEGQYVLGMASYNAKEYTDAVTALTYVSKNTTQAIASESKYTIAQIYFNQDKLKEADETAREVLKMKPTYDYWIAKSLILQTNILIKKDDLFQAEQTILSVLENYPKEDDGIKAEAQIVYDEVIKIKNQPKSNIVPEGTTEIEVNEGK